MKKLIVDVFYDESKNNAHAVGIVFDEFKDSKILDTVIQDLPIPYEYIPGNFYKREMPCIVKLIEKLDLREFDTIVVDGFYSLGDHAGLGQHLKEDFLDKKGFSNIEVIGISKTRFRNCEKFSYLAVRNSASPLYVNGSGNTDYGILVQEMDGEFRLPNLVKAVDKASRNK